jgi:hypothetical protein
VGWRESSLEEDWSEGVEKENEEEMMRGTKKARREKFKVNVE